MSHPLGGRFADLRPHIGEPFTVLYGEGVDDTFVGTDYRERTLDQALWRLLRDASCEHVAFSSPHRPLYFLDRESGARLRPAAARDRAAADEGPRRMRNPRLRGPLGPLVVSPPAAPEESAEDTGPGGAAGVRAPRGLSDPHTVLSLATYLRDPRYRSAVVVTGVEVVLRHSEAPRALDAFFDDWARNGIGGRPLVLVFAQLTLGDCLSYVESLGRYPALTARLRQQTEVPGRSSAHRVGVPDEAELHRLIQRARLRDGLTIGSWTGLDPLVRAMAAEQLLVKNWRARLASLGSAGLTRQALVDRRALSPTNRRLDPRPAHERLAELPGLEPVKEHLARLRQRVLTDRRLREQGRITDTEPAAPHLVFMGPPGTGKTTVARLVGEIYRELGLLSRGHLVEVRGEDLVAGFVGQTAGRTHAIVDRALDGVLFVDEAYALSDQSEHGFGGEAIQALLTRLENDRDRLLVVVAGYEDKMREFLAANPGLARRLPEHIHFPDHPPEVLLTILLRALRGRGPRWDQDFTELLRRAVADLHAARPPDFGNAGTMLTLADRITGHWAQRVGEDTEAPLTEADLPESFRPRLSAEPTTAPEELPELDGLVGLEEVRARFTRLARTIRHRQATGRPVPAPPHLVFAGPPGTGKTTVARAVGRLFHRLGLLRRGHVHEVTRADLVGGYIGQTAPLVVAAVREALDGVLFVDEAYALSRGGEQDFGREAIDTLVREMEHWNDRLVVVLAGYPRELATFLAANSGLASRCTMVEFRPYRVDELVEVLRRTAAADHYTLTPEVAERAAAWLAERAGSAGERFGNAREVRALYAEMEHRLAERLHAAGDGADPGTADFVPDDVPPPGTG